MARSSSSRTHLLVFLFLCCCTPLLISLPWALAAKQTVRTPLMLETCNKTAFNDDCVDMLSTSKKAVGATDVKGLAAVALEVTEKKASRVATHINNMNEENRSATLQCVADCVENYEDVVDQLNDSIGEMEKVIPGHPTDADDDIALWLSAAISDIDTCEKGCNMQATDKNILTDRNAEITKLSNITLSIVQQINAT